MTHHALYVCGEWLCVLSIVLFVCAALDSLKQREVHRRYKRAVLLAAYGVKPPKPKP